jgi:hypothetical protein
MTRLGADAMNDPQNPDNPVNVAENEQTPGRTEAAVPGSSQVSVPIADEGSTSTTPWQARLLSTARLQPYLDQAGTLEAALSLYDWNARLSAAFWEVIEGVEIVVRNAMHHALSEHHGPRWFDDSSLFDRRTDERIRATLGRVAERTGPRPAPPGLFLSESTFGLWIGLLAKGGKTSSGTSVLHQDTLWPALVHAFPGGPRHQAKTLAVLRWPHQVRNRIAHHENLIRPTWTPRQGPHAELTPEQVHQLCLMAPTWAEPAAGAWLRRRSRVLEILDQRPARV